MKGDFQFLSNSPKPKNGRENWRFKKISTSFRMEEKKFNLYSLRTFSNGVKKI